VAADAKLRTLGEDHAPVFFTTFSFAQMLVATTGNSAQWVQPLRNAHAHVDAEAAVEVRPLTDAAAGALFPMRIAATFAGSLAGIGLLLVLTGLYGSVSYATRAERVKWRSVQPGVTRSTILRTAMGDGITVLACGVVAGLPLPVAAIGPLTEILPDGVDPWSIGYVRRCCAGPACCWNWCSVDSRAGSRESGSRPRIEGRIVQCCCGK
jgi:hypothetical protein